MRRKTACVSMLITLLTVLIASSSVSAQTVIIPHTDRGWYNESGRHTPDNTNYIVGDERGPICSSCYADVRNFFVFDLSAVTQPIVSAKLELFVPEFSPGYESVNPSENYELHDVTTSIPVLRRGSTGGSVGIAAWTDLGSGVVYGSRTMTRNDLGKVVEITLNPAAIAALDAATGLIGIGGSLTTLDSKPNNEYTFAWTNNGTETTQLRLTLVPEPFTLVLLGISAISLLGYRKAKSRHHSVPLILGGG